MRLSKRQDNGTGGVENGAVAFLFSYGPEIRAFLFSRLIEEVNNKGPVVLFLAGPENDRWFSAVKGFPVIQMEERQESRVLTRIRSLTDGLHRKWADATLGLEKWNHYLGSDAKMGSSKMSLLNPIFGYRFFWRLANKIEGFLASLLGGNRAWVEEFQKHDVRTLVTSGYNGARNIVPLQSAANIGIRTVILTNSWKDIYTRLRIPIPFSVLGVWDERMVADVCDANPGYSPSSVFATGSLHLAALKGVRIFPNRAQLCEMIGLDPGRPIICYTAASPRAAVGEEKILAEIVNILKGWPKQKRPQILVRTNPMGGDGPFRALAVETDDIEVSLPNWDWDERRDWCCPSQSDLTLWRSIIEHSALNVSIASTVTLEFAMFGKPVINICFDSSEDLPGTWKSRRFWAAPFYAKAREMKIAAPAWTIGDLGDLLKEFLSPIGGSSENDSHRCELGIADLNTVGMLIHTGGGGS